MSLSDSTEAAVAAAAAVSGVNFAFLDLNIKLVSGMQPGREGMSMEPALPIACKSLPFIPGSS